MVKVIVERKYIYCQELEVPDDIIQDKTRLEHFIAESDTFPSELSQMDHMSVDVIDAETEEEIADY